VKKVTEFIKVEFYATNNFRELPIKIKWGKKNGMIKQILKKLAKDLEKKIFSPLRRAFFIGKFNIF